VIKLGKNDVWAKRSSWIKRAACEHNASELSNEKGKADANWSKESAFVLFSGKHETGIVGQKGEGIMKVLGMNIHGEDQKNRAEHFDEQASLNACLGVAAESRSNGKIPWKETRDNSSRSNTANDLSNGNNQESNPANSSNESKPKTHLFESESALHQTIIMEVVRLLTAGLNNPPLMRKKTQTLTARLKPKARAMYKSAPTVGCFAFGSASILATWVPAKAKKRKRKVPTSSPRKATNSFRTLVGNQ
jgi:hypothetical protein